jgi:uncharacterized protein YcnI
MALILALLVVVAVSSPAGAHPLATQAVVGVNQPITLNIGVPAEGATPMVGVDITIPRGFELAEVVPVAGWTVEQDKGAVRYRGGSVPVGGFALFTLRGKIPKKSTLRFPMLLRNADGTSQRWDDKDPADRYPAATVYAGTRPPKPGGGGSSAVGTLSKAALLGGGIGLALSLVLRFRRRGDDGA